VCSSDLPSLHFDGQTWRCVLRCSDYAMPDGVTIRSSKARPAGNQTKNAMAVFDPATWKPIKIYKMQELDGHPRVSCANVGYEDMRIFRTDRGGLQGIAASLHLDRGRQTNGAATQNQPPEQTLLSFDTEYNIVDACPIRGGAWSGVPQKNWVPFDHCTEPRFLYSIDRGSMFDDRGALQGEAAVVRASAAATPLVPQTTSFRASFTPSPEVDPAPKKEPPHVHPDRRTQLRGTDNVQLRGAIRGRRVVADALSSRPSASRFVSGSGTGSARIVSAGRALPPKYAGLRGGTQLVRVGDDAWLGIGHEMQFLQRKKHYWHTWYLVNSRGKMLSTSPPMKLAPNGIEFAAGMAIDGDRVVVSFGVDDMECKIGETRLSAVLETLQPVSR
jgi:hypothetical protein